jgi:hypothetical protein
MVFKITMIYCLCADLLSALHHPEDRQCTMSDAEVMTTAIVAALFFGGNYELARQHLFEEGYIPQMLSKSRFNRRLQRIQELFLLLFSTVGESWKELNEESVYIIDTLPIAVCDNIRISRSQVYQGEKYRGYKASKQRYFYGVKIHLLVTKDGHPVEFFLTPGAFSDTAGLEYFDFDLPPGAEVYGDKAYNHYLLEDNLADVEIALRPVRKKNSKRPFPPWVRYFQRLYRQAVETAGSLIERLLPKSIHAVTAEGFELKVVLFVLASSLNGLA